MDTGNGGYRRAVRVCVSSDGFIFYACMYVCSLFCTEGGKKSNMCHSAVTLAVCAWQCKEQWGISVFTSGAGLSFGTDYTLDGAGVW